MIKSISTFAQEKEICGLPESKKVQKKLQEANDLYKKFMFDEANLLYKKIIEEEPNCAPAYYNLGMINIKRKNIKPAENYLTKAVELCPDDYVDAFYWLAQIAIGRKEWKTATQYLEKYLKKTDIVEKDKNYPKAKNDYIYCRFIDSLYSNPVPFNPVPVEDISTPNDEYLPIITADNTMAFFTRKFPIPPKISAITKSSPEYAEKFFYSIRDEKTNKFTQGEPMPTPPFNRSINEGGATLTIDNLELYYTVCDYISTGYYNCDICMSKNVNGQWQPIKNLGPKVNLSDAWDSQPSISADGKTLYFTSDRPGGYGGYDIYKIVRDEKGNWSAPINLGPTINTPGNERSPFIHTDSQTLYFTSSDRQEGDNYYPGHMGLGGYDIFYSKYNEKGEWSKPKNIGYPINSPDDEIGFFVSTDGKKGYFASNKKELKGKGGWDLYEFDLYEGARPEKVLFISGYVQDEKTKNPVKSKIELINIETKKVTQIPVDTFTGKYAVAVTFKNDYLLKIEKEGYAYNSYYFAKDDTTFDKPKKVDIEVKKIEVGETYKLNDIYYETNSYELKPRSLHVLDGFVEFLKKNSSITVAIHGHTDDVGNENDNMILSENRAKAVYDYMVKKGISPSRLSYKGFGETKPIADNSTPEGRAKNRRTEFIILHK